MTADLTDPGVPLTDELRARMTLEQRNARDRRTYERMISWPADLRRPAENYVDDVGLGPAIIRITTWTRSVLRVPDTQAAAPLIAPLMEDRWRTCGRDLSGGLTRYGTAATYAREVIRDLLGLRGPTKAPTTLDVFHAHEIHAAASATAEHLAGLQNVRLPTRRPGA